MATGVRERARQTLREELAVSLSDLFALRGFDNVTVEEASREVGISRATFFRYFGSKEDAVVVAVERRAIDFGQTLAMLKPVESETVWQILHRTFRQALIRIDNEAEDEKARLRMIHTNPALRLRLAQRRDTHQEALTAALGERGVEPDVARTAVTACLAAVDIAWQQWATKEKPFFIEALDAVFSHLVLAGEVIRPR